MSVKMKQKNVMLISLVIAMAMLASSLVVFAKTPQAQAMNVKSYQGSNLKAVKAKEKKQVKATLIAKSRIKQGEKILTKVDVLSLDEIDPEAFDDIITSYEGIKDTVEVPNTGVWVVYARGLSWESNNLPTLTAEVCPGEHIGLRFIAKALWNTEDFILYEITRGGLGHNHTSYSVTGYAIYWKDTGRFGLTLSGDGVNSFNAVGRILGPPPATDCVRNSRCLRLAMKGRMSLEDGDYVFAMRGYARRLRLQRAEPQSDVKLTTAKVVA